jgi:hypothetical protein
MYLVVSAQAQRQARWMRLLRAKSGSRVWALISSTA